MSTDRPRLETKLRSTFGIKRILLRKDLEPDELFVTDFFTQSLDRLRYLVDRRGIGAVFGAPGTGKSTLLRALLAGLGKVAYSVCYVSHSTCAVLDLFREIVRGFAIEPRHSKADVIREVKDRILKLSRGQKIQPILVVDDAHLLHDRSLQRLQPDATAVLLLLALAADRRGASYYSRGRMADSLESMSIVSTAPSRDGSMQGSWTCGPGEPAVAMACGRSCPPKKASACAPASAGPAPIFSGRSASCRNSRADAPAAK